MVGISENQIREIGKVLNDINRPLKERFRALFTLRNIGGKVSIDCIKTCFQDSSELLKHELAYCLGQMQDKEANNILVDVLEDKNQEPMVRHEAAEALGALGLEENISILENFSNDPVIAVAETCQLAIDRLKWIKNSSNELEKLPENSYKSVDPAPPSLIQNVEELRDILTNEQLSLFERYRAMFSLRNIQTKDAILALGSALKCGSALFRHEIAFVLGQIQSEISVPFLRDSLEDLGENEMVRHECAEALGAIATEDCIDVLNKYLKDDKRVVNESCLVALDMCEYENSPEFQYANTLKLSS